MSLRHPAFWVVALIALLAALGFRMRMMSEPTPPPHAKIVFVTGGSGPYWQLTATGAKAAARNREIDLDVKMPTDDENVEEQNEILAELDPKAMDGLAISPLDAAGQTALINKLCDSTYVVTFDSDAPDTKRMGHVGTSNYSAGRACARLVTEAIPDGGKVAVLLANLTKENMLDRKGGFEERLVQVSGNAAPESNNPQYEIVGFFVDNGRSKKTEELILQTLSNNPDLACLVGMNAQHGPILLRVLKREGKLDKVKLVTFDEEEETLDGVEEGHIYATIAQDPYKFGYESVAMLASICRGKEGDLPPIVGRGSIYVGAEAIGQEDVDRFRSQLKKRIGQASDDQKN